MKTIKKCALIMLGASLVLPCSVFAAQNKATPEKEPTTRSDAVIFKVHNINPISEEGVVTGCDFTLTLYNRTSINFRNFTVNLDWNDPVDEQFKFSKYVEAVVPPEDLEKFKDVMKDDVADKPLSTTVTVNAFGADKQISVRSHIDSAKCYLMLNDATYSVTPCEIARSAAVAEMGINQDNKDCTGLFQFVSTNNPEYFGKFKRISLTDEVQQADLLESQELEDIDLVINKIVENMGVSDNTLNNIN
jgi:hypothetical protein